MADVLSAYPARPPTPPKTSHNAFENNGEPLSGRLNIPNSSCKSPSSTAESSVLRSSKKVNFSPITNYIKPQASSSFPSNLSNKIRSIPPSNECKPTKSILKTTTSVLIAGDMASTEESQLQSFAVLLESTMQQLAGESLSSRVDAYMQLLGALKAYELTPEQDMASKLGMLLQFIQRDLSRDADNRDVEQGDLVETNLCMNALKITLYIIWNEKLASQIPDDFKIFIIDHSLTVLQEGKLPKLILNHCISVLHTQNFSAKTMTSSRVTRILAVLIDITDRVTGNSILAHRLMVYTRLLGQSKTSMASQASLWIKNLISGLLHTMRDVRSRALTLGNQTALLLGPNMNISKTILDEFNKDLPKGGKLISEVCARMDRMLSLVDSGVHVPQIWGVIILLLRSKRFNLGRWTYFKEWVLVLQSCFNRSDSAIKSEAIAGWNKFVYVVSSSESTSMSVLKMLANPIVAERKRNEKAGAKFARMSPLFISSYYNLVYYTFRPSTPHERIDFIWEEYISQPFTNTFANSPQLNDAACTVLSCLLWTPQYKVWTDNKINECSRMEAESIVPIDCRWIRSRIVTVVAAFETLLPFSNWKHGNDASSNIATAWTHMCKALADASSKEIKPSAELIHAIVTILGMFERLRISGPASLNSKTNDVFLDRFSFLTTTLISVIGASPFTETLLLKTSQETFQAANTPTHRHLHADGNVDTPFMHILRIASSLGTQSELSRSFLGLIDNLLEAASKGRQSRSSRLDFLEKCTEVNLNENQANGSNSSLASYVWVATARLTIDCLASLPMETLRDRDGTLTRDYGYISNILLRGLPTIAPAMWSSLLDAYVRIIRTERGERGILTLVVEPIAKQLAHIRCERIYLPLKALVYQALSISYYQHNKSPATSTDSDYGSSVFLPDKLLELLDQFVTEAYIHFTAADSTALAEVIESLASFLGSGALQFRSILLERLQRPLALWLRDSAQCLTAENGADSRLLTSSRTLALAIANVLQEAVPHTTEYLDKFEEIVSAGLESAHKSIANRFIEMWNISFGKQKYIAYPPSVQNALQRLAPFVELQLPCPLPSQGNSKVIEMPDFVESQSQETRMGETILNPFRRGFGNIGSTVTRPTTFTSSPIVQSTEWGDGRATTQPLDTTPRQNRRRSPHDNSHVQFVAVDSSPHSADIEYQPFTEHQLEVRERQYNHASSFLEGLRSSSPVLLNPAEDTKALSPIQLPIIRNTVRDMEAPLTPILAINLQDNDDDFPGSSPTPAAKDSVSLQGQKASALAIDLLEVAQSDPPSSPPEMTSSRSARNEELMLRKSPRQDSEAKQPRNKESSAEESSERRRSSRISSIKSVGDSAGPTTTSEMQATAPHRENDAQVQNDVVNENSPINSIPDTYADEFEKQIASQLEQDLELAVDMEDKTDTQSIHSSDVNLPRGPVTRKRKRDAEMERFSTPESVKRRSQRKPKASHRRVTREESSQSDSDTKPATPQAPIFRRGISSPQSSPLKNYISIDDLSDKVPNSGSRRSSRRINVTTDREVFSSPMKPQTAETRQRRSLRLSGVTAESPRKDETFNEKSNTCRTQAQHQYAGNHELVALEKTQQDHAVEDFEMTKSGNVPDSLVSREVNVAPAPIHQVTSDETAAETQYLSAKEAPEIEADTVIVETSSENAVISLAAPDHKQSSDYVSQAVQTEGLIEVDVEDNESSSKHVANQPIGILGSLRQVLSDIKHATFGREVLREVDDVIFDIRVEAHEAARRGRT